ncbi:hypothetical protein RB601_009640 [Gaeumannomyces tritici]
MGARTGIALKGLQWFLRGVQFLSATIIFGIYCYFLGTLNGRNIEVPDWIRAVVGITGSACLYSGVGLLLLCWIAGRKFTSFLAILLDVAFAAAFIFVAVSNKGGAGSCDGALSTPFGDGDANSSRADGIPNYRTACKLQSACLAIAVVALVFFVFSAITEVALGRHHHKENRIGPSPDNGYTSGYGSKGGILGFLRRSGTTKTTGSNMLPKHATPADMREPAGRESYATEQTAVTEPSPVHASHHNPSRDPAPVPFYPNRYGEVTTGDDALPMNTASSVRPHNHTTSTANSPYEDIGNASSNPYDVSGRYAGTTNPYDGAGHASASPYSAGGRQASTNPYDTGAPGPYPGSYSRPRLSEDNRAPARQYPAGYRYSDGVYDA